MGKALNYPVIMRFSEALNLTQESYPFEVIGILQALIAATMSLCPRCKDGLFSYNADGRALSVAYRGPVRKDYPCQTGECYLDSKGFSRGLLPHRLLKSNTLERGALRGSTVFASHYPPRKGLKPLWGAKVAEVIYYSNEHMKDEDRYFAARSANPVRVISIEEAEWRKIKDLNEKGLWLTKVRELAKILEDLVCPVPFGEAGLLLALVNATRTHCVERRVGCVAFDALERLLGTANNGPLSGDVHCNEEEKRLGKGRGCNKHRKDPGGGFCIAEHAEENLLDNIPCVDMLSDSTVFVTTCTCRECMPLLGHNGVSQVVYLDAYNRVPTEVNPVTDETEEVLRIASQTGVILYEYTEKGFLAHTGPGRGNVILKI